MKNRNLNHSDDWMTPPEFYAKLNEEFDFNFDPCPYQHDITKWDGLQVEWGRNIYVNFLRSADILYNFIAWRRLNAHPARSLNQLTVLEYGQTEKGVIRPIVKHVPEPDIQLDKGLKLRIESSLQKSSNYYPLDSKNALDVKLSSHLIRLILLLTRGLDLDTHHIVDSASETMLEKKWLEKETILRRELELLIAKKSTENPLKERRLNEEALSFIITKLEDLTESLIGVMRNGRIVNYTLETSVPIVEKSEFLSKIILSLYQTLIAPEQSEQTLFHHAQAVIEKRDIKILKIGAHTQLTQESKNILDISLRIKENTTCWINPPYSRNLKEAFVKKAIYERDENGVRSVMLLPVSTSTKLFHDHILPNADDIRFVRGRIKFIGTNTFGEHVTTKAGMHDSMIVIFNCH